MILPTQYKERVRDVKYYILHAQNKPPLLLGTDSNKLNLIQLLYSIENYPVLKYTTALPVAYMLKEDQKTFLQWCILHDAHLML